MIFVILNPVAGNSAPEHIRTMLDRHCGALHQSYDLYETTGDERIEEVVRDALQRLDVEMVVAAGGDGTVSAVASGLNRTNIPLAILPVGTANVLAQELGIPTNVEAACHLLASSGHTTTWIDAMEVNDQHFFLQIGIGLDSLVIRDTERKHKRRFGMLAYLWTLITSLMGYQPRRFTILVDGQRHRPRASQVMVANGGTLAVPWLQWGPDIRPDDGRVDICIVFARNLADYLGLLWRALQRQHKRSPKLRYLAARESITITSDEPLPVEADGELLDTTTLQVRVIPRAVQVVVPCKNRQSYQSVEAGSEPAEHAERR